MKNVACIINPNSSNGKYHAALQAFQKVLHDDRILLSRSAQDTHEFIKKQWNDTDIFIAVGGDGTITSVARQLVHSDKILAILPGGSGNGFSREHQFNKDIDGLLSKIKSKQYRRIDTFTVNGHLSINVSGVGFDGVVTKLFEKTSRGLWNYIKVSLRTFFSYKPVETKFEDEKHVSRNGKYLMINVANTRQFGNNAFIAPHATTTDGLAEIVLVKKFPLWYGAIFAARLFAGTLKEDEYISYISTADISFSVNSRDWHLDGDYTEINSPVHIQVQPASLCVLQ